MLHIREKTNCLIGFSDHSTGVNAVSIAVAAGAKIVEKHFTLDKNQTGPSMILSEIGTHAYHLLRYVTGLEGEQLSAEVSSLSSEISVDDNAFILLRIKNNGSSPSRRHI